MKCGQAHCWRIAILRRQKVINKNLVYSQWCSIFLLFKGCIIQIVRCNLRGFVDLYMITNL